MESVMGYYLQQSPRSIEDSIIKAQFQQKQMQDKEHKLLQMLDTQQRVAMQKAAINGVLPSKYANSTYSNGSATSNAYNNYPTQPGKVRQMFEERRKGGGNNLYNSSSNGNTPNGTQRNGGIIGIDKSYPLDPLVTPTNGPGSKSRSLSSKSDPNPNTYARSNNVRNGTSNSTSVVSGNKLGTSNLNSNNNNKNTSNSNGLHKRGISLERGTPGSRSRDSRDSRERETVSPFSTNGPAIGTGPGMGAGMAHITTRRASSGLSNGYEDENSNHQIISNSRPLLSNNNTTTKYSELYSNSQGRTTPDDLLAKREKNLAMKMKSMQISQDKSPSSPESKSYGSSRSSSPPKRQTPAPRPKAISPVVKPAPVRKTASKNEPVQRGPPPPGLEGCRHCGRFFAPERLEKHEVICRKTANRKRKVFDPTKMRMQGTEAEPYIRRVSAKLSSKVSTPAPVRAESSASSKKADWRKKHDDFIKTIRAAKEYQAHIKAGGTAANFTGTVAPESDYSDYIQCPHCNRKFNQAAAERHIPKCSSIRSNKR